MYEDQDYLTIMERIMSRLPDDLDKAEGSLIWEAVGPAALELELVYMALDRAISNSYPVTADRESLIKFADTYNMAPYPASRAVLEAEFVLDGGRVVELGSRFEIEGVFYTVIERVSETRYKIECETPGTIGNRYYGQLLPVVYLRGFVSAQIKSLLIPGEDEEDTEEFRERFKRSFVSKAYGGNEADYIEFFVLPQQGVGDCKILRCPRGKGTVDVVIIDSLYRKPTPETIAKVQEAIRPLDVTGPPEIHKCGLGLAPIGHDTLVFGVEERSVDVGLKLFFEDGYDWDGLKPTIEKEIKAYFTELAMDWGDKNHYTEPRRKLPEERFLEVMLSKIEQRVLEIPGVRDYDRLATTLNGETENVVLEWNEIPVLGELTQSERGSGGGLQDGDCNCPDCPNERRCGECERAGNG